MRKRQLITLVCVVAVVAGAIGISRQSATGKSASTARSLPENRQTAPTDLPAQPEMNIPTQVVYGLFFGEILAFQKKAEEMDRQGLDGSFFRDYHKQLMGLSEPQWQILAGIAAACNTDVINLNQLARAIIDRERARHPHGKLNEGEALPTPPAQLAILEEQRTTTIMQAREQLRLALGEPDFTHLDDFVRQNIESRTKAVPRPTQP